MLTPKQEQIKKLFKQVDNKAKFILLVCEELGGRPSSKRNHWFCESGFWSVPEKHVDDVILLLEVYVQTQKKD